MPLESSLEVCIFFSQDDNLSAKYSEVTPPERGIVIPPHYLLETPPVACLFNQIEAANNIVTMLHYEKMHPAGDSTFPKYFNGCGILTVQDNI